MKRSRKYPAKAIADADYADDIAILANAPAQAETLLHSLERTAASIGLHVNAHKTEYMCFNQTGEFSTQGSSSLKLVDKFTYLGSSVSSTEKDIDTRLTKAWKATDRLSVIWKSDLTDKKKRSSFQATVVSILLYGCTTWTLIKRRRKSLTATTQECWEQFWTSPGGNTPQSTSCTATYLPPRKISKLDEPDTRDTAGEVGDELKSDVLQWTPSYDWVKAGRPARTYIQLLCEDTGCSPEDLPEVMNDREGWRERVRDIRAGGMTWWYIYIIVYI